MALGGLRAAGARLVADFFAGPARPFAAELTARGRCGVASETDATARRGAGLAVAFVTVSAPSRPRRPMRLGRVAGSAPRTPSSVAGAFDLGFFDPVSPIAGAV